MIEIVSTHEEVIDRKILPGQLYKHFKGHTYEVICTGKDTTTLEDFVVYKEYNKPDPKIWIRKLSEFNSYVDKQKYPDVKQELRFDFIR